MASDLRKLTLIAWFFSLKREYQRHNTFLWVLRTKKVTKMQKSFQFQNSECWTLLPHLPPRKAGLPWKRSQRNTFGVNSVPSSFWLQVAACLKHGKHPLLQAKILSNLVLRLLQKTHAHANPPSSSCFLSSTAPCQVLGSDPGAPTPVPSKQYRW